MRQTSPAQSPGLELSSILPLRDILPCGHQLLQTLHFPFLETIMPKLATLDDLFFHELMDILDAEEQLVQALPEMADAASSEELVSAFGDHAKETDGQVERLHRILRELGRKPERKSCVAMQGLVREAKELIAEDPDEAVLDAGLIVAAQKVEHYEIAAYGSLVTFARRLGYAGAESLLEATLTEEKETDRKLTELAEAEVNVVAEDEG